MADSKIQIKLDRRLVDRAKAWAEGELGSMSPSASVALVLREVMPMLERKAMWGRLDQEAEDRAGEIHAAYDAGDIDDKEYERQLRELTERQLAESGKATIWTDTRATRPTPESEGD